MQMTERDSKPEPGRRPFAGGSVLNCAGWGDEQTETLWNG